MKFLLVATFSLMSLSSWANMHKDHDKMWDKMSFEDAKKMKSEMLTQKRTLIEEAQNCVGSAKDKAAIKACMHTMKEDKREMKSQMKDKKKNM